MGKLFWKIFISLWGILLLTAFLVVVVIWQHNEERIKHLEALVNTPQADVNVSTIAKALKKGGVDKLDKIIERRSKRKRRPLPMFIVDKDGFDLLGRAVPDIMLEKAHQALTDGQRQSVQEVITPEGETFLIFIPRRDHPAMQSEQFDPKYLPVWPLLAIFIASLIFSAGLAWYITRPVKILREATNRFAVGQLDFRVMSLMGKRRDEITELANDFDHMSEQLQQSIAAQKRLLNDVSHELRSPLSRLQMAVEMGQQQPEKLLQLMPRVEKESQRLDNLVGELLTLSRLEANTRLTEADCFELNGLIQAIVDDADFEAQQKNIMIKFHSEKDILFKGSIELMRRAIENCIRNAVFYIPESGQIIISLSKDNTKITLSICDSGPGVSEEKLSQLFEPFIRLSDDSQNINTPGYGLGLAIARRAVEVHQGHISAYNQAKGGLCLEMIFPVTIDRMK